MDPGDNSVQPGFVEGFTFGEIRIDNLGQDQYGHKNVQYAKNLYALRGLVATKVHA